MFVKSNSLDEPSHHREVISKVDAGKAFAPIFVKGIVGGVLAGCILVLIVAWYFADSPTFISIAEVTGALIAAISLISYFLLWILRDKHRRYLSRYGIKEECWK